VLNHQPAAVAAVAQAKLIGRQLSWLAWRLVMSRYNEDGLGLLIVPVALVYLGAGLIAWIVGFGVGPLLVLGVSTIAIAKFYRKLEEHGLSWLMD
jgi:hypothetical protein